jgi:hypothetical protein
MDVDEALKSQLRNIEATYGKPIGAWIKLIEASGLTKHNEVVAMLKSDHGMTHGAAHRVSLTARAASAGRSDSRKGDPADQLYVGAKSGLRPIHDRMMTKISRLGDDIGSAPKKGYISLRRVKQFAMIQPSTATRVDVGLILRGVSPTERLEAAGSWNALFTHRVRLVRPADVDAELVRWLREAYQQAG